MAKEKNTLDIPKKVETSKEEMVTIPKKDFENVLSKLEGLEKNQERLLGAIDKSQLARYDAITGGVRPLIRKVSLSTWGQNGKIVTSWKMIVNESFIDSKGIHENQQVNVTLEDGTVLERISLVDFYRNINKGTKGEIIGSKQENGKDFLKIQLEDGRELELQLPFIN